MGHVVHRDRRCSRERAKGLFVASFIGIGAGVVIAASTC
jgi:hypothetical protein